MTRAVGEGGEGPITEEARVTRRSLHHNSPKSRKSARHMHAAVRLLGVEGVISRADDQSFHMSPSRHNSQRG